MSAAIDEELKKYICCYESLAHDVIIDPLDPAYMVRFADLRGFMHDTRSERVLDIGSSQGIFLKGIKAKDKFAFDISMTFLKIVPKSLNPVRGNAETLPFRDRVFDTVVASDILEHVFNPDLVIREAHRILVPGGKFYIVVPWKEDISVYEKFKGKYDYCHLRTFDAETITKMLKQNGFSGTIRIRGSLPKIPGLWRIYYISPWLYNFISDRSKPVHMMIEVLA